MSRADGIDVAHYQLVIDWAQVKAAGVFWVACKATQGTGYVDPTFKRNRQGMAANGFRHRLFYHWLNPNVDPGLQAAHFLRTVGQLATGEGVMLDAEENGITASGSAAWCRAVERVTGRPCAVYTGAFVGTPRLWKSVELFDGARPRVLAAYTTEVKARTYAAPHVWDAWQFTSSGTVPGVPNRVDCDQVDNPTIFDVACGLDHAQPVHPPDPEPAQPVHDPAPKPLPNLEGEMRNAILRIVDDGATLVGIASDTGEVLNARWTGPGTDRVYAWLTDLRAGGAVDMEVTRHDVRNVILDGPLPPGYVLSDFAPPTRG